MLKQTKIELDRKQIQSIKQKSLFQWEQSNKQEGKSQKIQTIQYELVKEEIFPKDFIPFCVDQHSRESSLKLYEVTKSLYDMELLNTRIHLLYEAVNTLINEEIQKQTLIHILRLEEVSNLVTHLNEFPQSVTQTQYIPYYEEGIPLDKVQLWRFKHTQQNPKIPYDQRSSLMKDYQLILKLVVHLIKIKQFQHLNLDSHSILMLQYDKCSDFKTLFHLRLKCQWIFDLLVEKQIIKVNDSDLLQNSKKIFKKILGIAEEMPTRSQLDKHHYEKIQYLSLHDIIKLNYHDFYFLKSNQSLNQTKDLLNESSKQQLQKLKDQILYLEDLAKNELKGLKLQNLQPKINDTTKQTNKHLWITIEQYILKNVTQSQRKNILTLAEKKPNPQTNEIKKPEKKPSTSKIKKQSKPEPKELSKIEKKEQISERIVKNPTQKQVIIESNFIVSASDIKFRPQKLVQLIQGKESIIYLLKTKNKDSGEQNHIVCYINCKPQPQNFNLLGSYSSDASKKSFIYSSRTDKFYKLMDKNYAVGYGSEIFFSIGKLDIIVPSFGTETFDGRQWIKCLSYFPLSYSGKGIEINAIENIPVDDAGQLNHQNQHDELGIGREFLLQEIDIYEIKLNAK